MARISATLERTFIVKAPPAKVYAFFADPMQLREQMAGLERLEDLGDGKIRWVLEEKVDKGIKFKGEYTVQYTNNGKDEVVWTFVEGNMGNEGRVKVTPAPGGGSEIEYVETVEPDLPITMILAKLVKPIVSRELQGDVGGFLERIEKYFNR